MKNMIKELFKKLTNNSDIAIDLGTANTLIWVKGQGIILNEPSIVARDVINDKICAVGNEANKMLGRTPPGLETIRPLQDGVIADDDMANEMIKEFLKKINISNFSRPRIIICIPSGVTKLEERAIKEAAEVGGNASQVYLIKEPMAAAIGIGIDVSSHTGHMIVDIGGGTTEIAVIALNDIVCLKTIKNAGDRQTDLIVSWMHDNHQLEIGLKTAEDIKKSIGSAIKLHSEKFNVTGKDITSGLPKRIQISTDEITKALHPAVSDITEAIKQALDMTPPEHSTDIKSHGIILTGGGSLLKGLDIFIRNKTQLPVNVSEDPLLAIVKGTGKVLNEIDDYNKKRILINT